MIFIIVICNIFFLQLQNIGFIPMTGHMAIKPVVNKSAEEIVCEQNLAWSVII